MKMTKRILSLALALVMILSYIPAAAFAADSAPALPTASVKEISNDELTFAMNFKVNPITEEQLAYYGNWYADFELTINKDVTFNADGSADGWLSGQYDEWSENWVNVPFGKFAPATIKANEPLRIMAFAAKLMGEPGLKYTYKEVYEAVRDFDCGVFFDDEFLLANPDLEVKLELKMYNPANEAESYVIGETYTYENPIVAKNTTTNKAYATATEALLDCADGQTVVMLKDSVESVVYVFENMTLDLNGHTLVANYMSSFGNIIDSSASNAGLLKVSPKRIVLQEKNKQLPVRDGDGYRFVKVLRIDTAYVAAEKMFAFQPRFEPGMLELMKQSQDLTGVTIEVQVSWKENNGRRTQNFVYTDEFVQIYLNSYNPSADRYGQMFTLILDSTEGFEDLTFAAVAVSNTGVGVSSDDPIEEEPGNVTTDANGQVVNDVTIGNGNASAVVPSGTQLENGVNNVTLNATTMEKTTSNITLGDGEQMVSMNVHVDGVAANNTKPIIVTLNELAPEFLNQGNLALYHVENGETVEMTRVYALSEVDAHNEYYYDIATGTVTMALATFSEIAVRSTKANSWNGVINTKWYNTTDKSFVIYNADQLAGLGAIVGGMAEGIAQDSFAGKTVKLMADIDLNDGEEDGKIFYPIGYYYTDDKNDDGTTGDYYSTVYNFKGTFDGNGNTIANFYQNTWEIKGDYDGNYYDVAMGLFGYVVDATVMNLTVDNFSSDGEFTPTGVIAAYAENSTFKNIALTNCNPRVYNTGNGGIVGIGGRSDDNEEAKLTFENITIDNTNKITALWGSWDVACGGLVGMFRGAGHVYMTNCHVAAQIDVYNDVCGNYQYYWYRYAGMLIGTNKNMVTDTNGYTVPETTKYHAEGCTVHFGDWNNYYYCELVANSLASYTHDHQFSRLTEIKSLSEIKDGDTWLKTGNFLLIEGENKTCYHIVKDAEGNLKQHLHTDAGYEASIDEDGDGNVDLKEDKQIVYLPFNQLFTGYGWGVKHIPITDYPAEQIKILDREIADSIDKFAPVENGNSVFATGSTITIDKLFEAIELGDLETLLGIRDGNVQVFVSPVEENGTVRGEYAANADDWTKGKLTLSGTGAAIITITDYFYCTSTSVLVNVTDEVYIATKRTEGNYWYMTSNLGTASTKRYQAVDSGLTTLPGVITAAEDGKVFILVPQADGSYKIKVKNTEQYLGWTSDNSGELVAADKALVLTWKNNEDGTVSFYFFDADAEEAEHQYRYLSLNNTTGNNYFAWYAGTQKQNLTLIPAQECAHANTTKQPEVPATCVAEGYTAGVFCDDCKTYISGHEAIVKTEHNVVDGKCTTEGCDYTAAQPDAPVVQEGWYLVEDVKDLQIGDKIIIVAKEYNYALSTIQNDNNRGQAKYEGGEPGADVQILILQEGTKANTFAFYTGSGYLCAASSSKNYLRTETKLSDNSSWKIAIADGTATIVAQGTNSRNTMQYNQSSSLFACYSGASQKAIVIYKLTEGTTGGDAPACEHADTTTINAKDATCTATGYTGDTYCNDCEQIIAQGQEISKKDHSYDNGVVTTKPSCTEPGVLTKTCSACGDKKTETIQATGHNVVDGKCTNEGCDYVETTEPTTKEVIFNLGANGSASHSDGSSKTAYSETNDKYALELTGGTQFYTGARDAKGNSCIKLGAKSSAGEFSFTVAENVTKVVIYVAGYKANKAMIKVNNTSYTISTLSNNGEYTAIEIDTATDKTVTFTTASGGYRAMVDKIVFAVAS